MGLVRPLRLLALLGPPFLSPPPRFVLRWVGGLLRSWGLPPISCIRPRTKGVCACSVGAPPLLRAGRCSPPPPRVPECRTLEAHAARGVPPPRWPGLPPPSLSYILCAGSAHCSGGPPVASLGVSPPPSPSCRALGAHTAQGMPPPPPPGSVSPPLPSLAYRALGAHAVVRGGPPLPPGSSCAR